MTTSQHLDPSALALAVAAAAAAVMPAADELEAGGVQPGTPEVTGLFVGAVVADLGGPGGGVIGLLVAEDLVAALESSPIGGLDLPAAVQPALDAAATALGATAGAARQVDRDQVVATVLGGSDAGFTVVPLVGESIEAAVLLADRTLAAHLAGGPAVPAATAVPTGPTVDTTGAPVPADLTSPLVAGATAAGVPPVVGATVPAAGAARRGIEMLNDVDMEVTVELGRTRMTLRDLLALSPGHVLELDRAAGSPADLLVNGHLIARGEVVVIDEDFGLRVTEILETAAAS
ncbi:flagellar motor switch protein FliN [Nocardioides sp. SYSU DS0663]|uniref:flagellar motor switch protein FliN n=1 Tax=Nocardioides sp. SYSU DS0663 TaxID=3416445 RepID=UPI003F4C7158